MNGIRKISTREISDGVNSAASDWEGWNDLYTWEMTAKLPFDAMKSRIIVKATELAEKIILRNAKLEYSKILSEAKKLIRIELKIPSESDPFGPKIYDWNEARRLYYIHNHLLPNSMIRCGNPDCKKRYKIRASLSELHHLLPRAVSPSLTYETDNMVLICKECHDKIHEGWKAYWELKSRFDGMIKKYKK